MGTGEAAAGQFVNASGTHVVARIATSLVFLELHIAKEQGKRHSRVYRYATMDVERIARPQAVA
jgi:hypothetical protein